MVSTAKKLIYFVAVTAMLFSPVFVQSAEHVVEIIGTSFSPPVISIPIGDSVRWKNNTSGLFHTTTSGTGCVADGIWNLSLPFMSEVVVPFPTAGTYLYFCVPHCGVNMTGTVIVEETVPVREKTWGSIKALYVGARAQRGY